VFLYLKDKIIPMDATETQIKKALVSFAIEKALLNLGEPVYQKVTKTLKDDYDCFIPDCYDNPEYLKRILADMYGNAHTTIINSIKSDLEEFSSQGPIQKFVLALG
jgi:nitrogen-specific signal transduction histidine kinase